MALDRYDRAILQALQRDGRLSNRDLAERVGLSAAPCWRRVKRLEDEGYIRNYIALLNPQKLDLTVFAFAEISLDNHHADTLEAFNEVVQSSPEILECHSVSGSFDYLLKIVEKDMQSYEHFLSGTLLQVPGIRSVSTMFSLKQGKVTRELPMN
ncbi:Lrp/AsnC family transcriptional regulator [Pseudomaricurvus alkylphenolicus]|jgi:DNA-binding Lrp family transcriptional regulator|uniref:Lrp/AsnC family transcriptional regulator n=1 Tax=Pseudomaricurvus alkylphenolicus TaxID=1306991 RepID=UPI0014212726|nr:Lrp/AsnC family transcriptional regulator [Pseudomaricurvus alkylphenolicus]NIB43619.1 Lrp/AsnC family transcriptional regulator [Pseudomaricurvus alkylphenolicus]